MPVNDGDARLLNIVSNSDFGSLISNPPSTLKNYVFKENITISSNIVVSDKLTFEPQDGAMFVKSGSGTITFSGIGIAAEDISHYAQVFSGFAPGDIKWGDQMPSEIWATWFGAKPIPGGMGSTIPAGYDTLPVMQTIQAAFTKGGNNPVGTVVKFPMGDFAFSSEFRMFNAYSIQGVENNSHFAYGTSLIFPRSGNGIVIDRAVPNPITEKGRPSGFVTKNLQIAFFGDLPPQATFTFGVNSTVTTSEVGSFDFERTAAGAMFPLPVTGIPVELGEKTRMLDALSSSLTLSNPVNGKYTRLTTNFTIGSFTSQMVGDTVIMIRSPGFKYVMRMARITNYVSANVVDITPIEGFDAAMSGWTATSIPEPIYLHVYSGKSRPYRPLRARWNIPASANLGFNVDAVLLGSTYTDVATGFSATVTAVTPLTLSAPIPTNASGNRVIQFTNLTGTVTSTLMNKGGLRAIYGALGLVENVSVVGAAGDGFLLDNVFSEGYGNNDHIKLESVRAVENRGHGFHFYGTDTHEVKLENFDARGNGGYGIYDETGTGMTVTAGHIAYNWGVVKNVGDSNQTVFKDIYNEGGALGTLLGRHAIWIGGTNGNGFQPDSQGALTLHTFYTKEGVDSQVYGARTGGSGLVNFTTDNSFQSRLWGDMPNTTAPILSGAAAARNIPGGGFGGIFNPGVVADWSLYHSTQGVEFGKGYTKASGYYGAGFNVDRKSWNTKRLEIGDDTDNAKSSGHFVTVLAGVAPPVGGAYPKGTRVYNINHDGTNSDYWVNTVEGGSTWFAVKPGSAGSLALYFADDFNRANGAIGNSWTSAATGLFSQKAPLITSNQLTWAQNTPGMVFRTNSLLDSMQTVKLVSQVGAGGVVLGARFQNDTNGYFAGYETASWDGIYKLHNNSVTNLVTGISRNPTANDVVRFTVSGSLLKLEILVNGVVVESLEVVDTTFATAGRCGLGDDWGGSTVDDYVLQGL